MCIIQFKEQIKKYPLSTLVAASIGHMSRQSKHPNVVTQVYEWRVLPKQDNDMKVYDDQCIQNNSRNIRSSR